VLAAVLAELGRFEDALREAQRADLRRSFVMREPWRLPAD